MLSLMLRVTSIAESVEASHDRPRRAIASTAVNRALAAATVMCCATFAECAVVSQFEKISSERARDERIDYMNDRRRLNAATSALVSTNHSPLRRRSLNRSCQ